MQRYCFGQVPVLSAVVVYESTDDAGVDRDKGIKRLGASCSRYAGCVNNVAYACAVMSLG